MVNKNAGVKGAITSKREDNQTPTFYIIVESIYDFITKSQNKVQRRLLTKRRLLKVFMLSLQDQQQNTFLVYGKAKNR